jgi:hypothetical protein
MLFVSDKVMNLLSKTSRQIGTGGTCNHKSAQEANSELRAVLAERYGQRGIATN